MIYLQANKNSRKKQIRLIAGIFFLFIVIVILMQIIFPHFVPAVVTSIARPFWRAEFSIDSGSMQSAETLLAQNESLKLELAEAEIRLSTIRAIEDENTALKSFFGIKEEQSIVDNGTSSVAYSIFEKMLNSSLKNKRTLAPVLIRPGEGYYDELIIDGGKDMNFNIGSKVYAVGNVLIGTISDVQTQTSKVSLFSRPDNSLNILIGKDNHPATAIGRGGGQFSAEIPYSVAVDKGDFIVVPSIDDKPFGIVSEVDRDPAKSFATVYFASPVNIYSLRYVLVGSHNE